MREALFCGKAVDNGEFLDCKGKWVEGGITFFKGGIPYICPERFSDYNEEIEVDPDTVSEFTGLRDKNGKRIFEGNIIKVDVIGGGKRICEVGIGECYDTDGEKVFGVWAKYDENKLILPTASQYIELYEVIGNKWDNPELLEGGEE